jgi:prepilin-type N-terminal cleavage/methylation domain-containing protein
LSVGAPDSSPERGLPRKQTTGILRLMVRSGPRSSVLRRVAGQAGYTLIETLVVMSLLVIVIGALADGFTSASKTEYDQTARADDQEAARMALERMRKDIHCASSAHVQQTLDSNGNPVVPTGYTLNLTVNPNQCVGVTTSGSDGVQWCTVSIGGSTTHYALYRTVTTACDAADAVFQVDHVTQPNVWTKVCSSALLEGIAIDLPVNRDILTRPGRTYELTDTIALRNDTANSGNTECTGG